MPDPLKHIILGTAGHIDHGKTELVRALTGVDTDRLREEKDRGISIELGFARFDLPSGTALGVIDVPGHERFVKTMLAGAGGIDLVLLVVAADEGVMPQTREHLDIIDLLGVRAGIVAITKTDLVGSEEVEFARAEVAELTAGTALEEAPVVPVSAVTREGLDELTARLEELAGAVEERASAGPARLPVDRVFSLPGHGTIVTGTLWSGSIAPGDRLAVYPSGAQVRVRSVQVHDRSVDRAEAGQRTALALAGVDKDSLSRGDTLGAVGALHVSRMFDARLRLVGGARPIENRTRVHLHLGTSQALARVVLLETDVLRPGEDELVQVRLESPIVAERDDLFVIRSYSPVTTTGGGRVLDPEPRRHKRMREDVIEALTVLEEGSSEDVLLQAVEEAGVEGLAVSDVTEKLGPQGEGVAEALVRDGRILEIEGRLHTAGRVDELSDRIREILSERASASPLEWGMSAEELRGTLSRRMERRTLDALLARLAERGEIARRGDLVRLGRDEVALNEQQEELAERIESRLRKAGPAVPSLDELRSEMGSPDFDAIVKLLCETGRIVKVTTTLLFHRSVVDDVRARVLRRLDEQATLGVPEFKDMVGVSRKYAIPLLEFFDREGTTMRSGNVRVKGRQAR
ncbi:MAG: selenocysteine-specific translation elongation factor [Candidatus Eisenbacteria bacterium]|nr:selenocysteine-specific translation elongation factor [Candidatus Eisenbacteria bacterium]